MEQLQRKRSFNTPTTSHDFRKEFKGSVLETKLQTKTDKSRFRTIIDWISKKSGKKVNTKKVVETIQEESSPIDAIPNEVLFEILQNCVTDKKTLLACRRVSQRFNAVSDHLAPKDKTVLSRLIINGKAKRGIELRGVTYEGQNCSTTTVTAQQLKDHTLLQFNFERFTIQRLIIKDVALTDDLVHFIRERLSVADLSQFVQLSLNNVDFTPSNSLSLHHILAPVSKHLEIFEITNCFGMRSDSLTNEHFVQLNGTRVRRVSIDGVRFGVGRAKALDVGDETLKMFAESRTFPTMVLDRCTVTTKMVCDYTQQWFDLANDSEKGLRSQICTVKRCPQVRGTAFEEECARRGLRCYNRRGSGSLTLYNVQEENREFTVALATALEEESKVAKAEVLQKSLQAPQPVQVAV